MRIIFKILLFPLAFIVYLIKFIGVLLTAPFVLFTMFIVMLYEETYDSLGIK